MPVEKFCFSSLSVHLDYLGKKCSNAASDSVGLGSALQVCISKESTGDVEVARVPVAGEQLVANNTVTS